MTLERAIQNLVNLKKPTEDEVRALRDAVYGPQTDHEWEICKHNWMRPDSVEWLREKAKREIIV